MAPRSSWNYRMRLVARSQLQSGCDQQTVGQCWQEHAKRAEFSALAVWGAGDEASFFHGV